MDITPATRGNVQPIHPHPLRFLLEPRAVPWCGVRTWLLHDGEEQDYGDTKGDAPGLSQMGASEVAPEATSVFRIRSTFHTSSTVIN